MLEREGPWLTDEQRAAAGALGGFGRKNFSVLELPDVGLAGIDYFRDIDWIGDVRYVVNLETNGNLYFKGQRWPVRGPLGQQGWARLLAELQRLMRLFEDRRRPDETRQVCLLVRADRASAWSQVLTAIRVSRDPAVRIDRLQFAVADIGTGYEGRIDASVVEKPEKEGAPAGAAMVSLRRIGTTAVSETSGTRIAVGEKTWELRDWDAFGGEAAVEKINRAWAEIALALKSGAGGLAAGADLRIEGDVWWAYVAETLSLLLEYGMRDVTLPDSSLTLRLSLPPSVTVFRVGAAADWDPLLAIGIGALAAVVAFAIGQRGLRSRPRRGKAEGGP